MKNKSKLKVGVIGLGIGRGHIHGYMKHARASVVAIADPDVERLRDTGNEFAIENRYTSAEEMIDKENLDIVSIAVPNKFHHPLTMAALEAGCHVLCEKPPAMTVAETEEMIAAAERVGRKLMINFSFRYTPQSQALKKEVESGTFGDFYYGRTFWHRRRGMPGFGGWFGNKELAGGGPLIDLGVHRVDLAMWLMGYPKPELIVGSTYNKIAAPIAAAEKKEFTVEDLACGLVKFDNGASLTIEASWAGHIGQDEWMETRLWGTEGGLVQRNRDGGYEFEAEFYTEKNGCQYNIKVGKPPNAVLSSMYDMVD